MKTPIGSFK